MKTSPSKSIFKMEEPVQWQWLGRPIAGVVKEIFLTPVEKTLKGKKIKRNGSPENPAYLVQSEAGNLALKLHSELRPSAVKKPRSSRPEMFD